VRSTALFSLAGFLLALVLSTGLVFAQEYLDSSFRTPSEVLSELKIPVLASVPLYSANGNGSAHIFNDNGNGNGTAPIAVPVSEEAGTAYDSENMDYQR
jgi:hypothetical protein